MYTHAISDVAINIFTNGGGNRKNCKVYTDIWHLSKNYERHKVIFLSDLEREDPGSNPTRLSFFFFL